MPTQKTTAPAALVPPPGSPYWRFYADVAAAQLAEWMPTEPACVLDLSGGEFDFAGQLRQAGHQVISLATSTEGGSAERLTVMADVRDLSWLRDASVDAILAEGNTLSLCLAAEVTVEDVLRVLRPGGRLLLVVDSLLLGLARLADQERWAELADVPSADVLLVAGRTGEISRCFWPEELEALLSSAGFDVAWVRPRSVLSPAAVERALDQGDDPVGKVLASLVRTELALARAGQGASAGMHLVASARRPALG